MNELHKHEMTSPAGTLHMVLERDRVAFEERGYVVTGSIDPLPAIEKAAAAPEAAPGPPAAVPHSAAAARKTKAGAAGKS